MLTIILPVETPIIPYPVFLAFLVASALAYATLVAFEYVEKIVEEDE